MKRMLATIAWVASLLLLGISVVAAGSDGPLAYEVRWSPDGRWIGVSSTQGAWFFDTENLDAEPLHWLEGDSISTLTFDPSGLRVALFDDTVGAVKSLKVEDGDEFYSTETTPSPDEYSSVGYAIEYVNDGRLLASTNASIFYLLEPSTGRQRESYWVSNPPHDYATDVWITTVAQSNDPKIVLMGTFGGNIMEYALDGTPTIDAYHDTGSGIYRIEAVPYTDSVIVLNYDGLFTYDLKTDEQTLIDESYADAADGFDLNPIGDSLAVGQTGKWTLYSLTDTEVRLEVPLENTESRLFSLSFSPDSTRLVTLDTDGHITIWDAANGEAIASLGSFTRGVSYKWG